MLNKHRAIIFTAVTVGERRFKIIGNQDVMEKY
jgi:hypothetical protein